ncbi:MAG TPA: O-antigen ligase family protein [bacterium]|nr:O-antigen ligase family protein [bacterium]
MGRFLERIDKTLWRIGDLLIVSLLITIPLLVDLDTVYPTGPVSKNFLLVYGVFSALLFLGVRMILFARRIEITLTQGALIVFGLYLIARAVWDSQRDYALGFAAPHIASVTLALMISYLYRARTQLAPHLIALALATALAVLYAVSQIFEYDLLFRLVFGVEGTWSNPLFEEERAVVFSTFGNPNYFAHFLGPAILLGVAGAFSARGKAARIVWWVALAISLFVLFRTYNRGIVLGVFTGGCIWGVSLLSRRFFMRREARSWRSFVKVRWILAGVALLVILFAAIAWLPVFEPMVRRFRTGILLRDTSVRSRLLFWFVALLMWKSNPWIGIGMGRYDPRFFDYLLDLARGQYGETLRNLTQKMVSLRAVYAHCDYMQFLAEWGSVGLGLFLLVVVLVFVAAVRVVRRDLWNDSSSAFAGIGLLAAYSSFLVQLLYDFPLFLPSSEMLFFFLIGCILVLERESGAETGRLHVRQRWLCALIGLVLLAPFAWSLDRITAKFSASHHLYHGRNNMRAGKYLIGDRELEIASRLDPQDGEIIFYRALNYASRDDTVLQAIDQFPRSLETYQSSYYYFHVGIAHLAAKSYGRAREALDKLIVIHPTLKGANYALGLCHFQNPYGADYRKAAEYFQREVQEYPDDIHSWLYLGDCKIRLNDLYGARDAFHKVTQLHDRNVTANESLGNIYSTPGEMFHLEVALEYYHRAFIIAGELGDTRKVAELRNRIEELRPAISGH